MILSYDLLNPEVNDASKNSNSSSRGEIEMLEDCK